MEVHALSVLENCSYRIHPSRQLPRVIDLRRDLELGAIGAVKATQLSSGAALLPHPLPAPRALQSKTPRDLRKQCE